MKRHGASSRCVGNAFGGMNAASLRPRCITFLMILTTAVGLAFSGCSYDPLSAALKDRADTILNLAFFISPAATGPRVESVTPADWAQAVPVDTELTIRFSEEMNPATVTVQSSDGPCSGSVQLSFNDFVTCLKGAITTSDNITFTVTPAGKLTTCTTYRVRVTTDARTAKGEAVTAQFDQEHGFDTEADADWIEHEGNPIIHGGGASGVDRAYYPAVIKVASMYHIWYGDGEHTRHAESSFPDFRDVTFPAPIVTGLDGSYTPYHPRVAYSASGWIIGGSSYAGPFVMYYTNGSNWTNPPRVAHSADGQAWHDIGACTGVNTYGGNTTVYNLSVLYEGGSVWKAYADNGLGYIQYYTSSDGINWSGQAKDIVGAPYQAWESATWRTISPFIYKYNSKYLLYYSSGTTGNDKAFGVAVSGDGASFAKSADNPIFSINDGVSWRDVRTYTTSIVRDGNGWLLYFSGRTDTPSTKYSIGMARKCGSLP